MNKEKTPITWKLNNIFDKKSDYSDSFEKITEKESSEMVQSVLKNYTLLQSVLNPGPDNKEVKHIILGSPNSSLSISNDNYSKLVKCLSNSNYHLYDLMKSLG